MLPGRSNLLCIFSHLSTVFCISGQQSRKSKNRVHRSTNIMGHIGKKHGLGIACNLCCLQCLRQLYIMYLSFRLPFYPQSPLLFFVKIIQNTTQEKRCQHNKDNNQYVLIYRCSFLLDRLDGHITDQINRAVVDCPHIDQRVFILDIMIEHNIFPGGYMLCHFFLQILFENAIRPIEIFQIQMTCVAFSRPFRLQYKPLAFCIHNIEHGTAVVKPSWQRLFKGIINIFDIEHSYLFVIFYHRTFHRICPCSHIIYVGPRNRQLFHRCPGRKIQFFFCEHIPCIGNSLCFPGQYDRYLYHRPVSVIGTNKFFRFFYCCNLQGNQLLEIRFFYQNRLHCPFDQHETFAQIIDGRR